MTFQQFAGLGSKLAAWLRLFADCFGRRQGRALLGVYVQGQLSDLQRQTAEDIAFDFHGWMQQPKMLRSASKRSKNAAGASSTHAWRGVDLPAKLATGYHTRPCFASGRGNATASRTRTRGRRSVNGNR